MTREEAIKDIQENIKPFVGGKSLDMAIEALKSEPRKHGQWLETEKWAKLTAYECSECGRVVWDDTGYDVSKDYPYCHCGADMRGGENEC